MDNPVKDILCSVLRWIDKCTPETERFIVRDSWPGGTVNEIFVRQMRQQMSVLHFPKAHHSIIRCRQGANISNDWQAGCVAH